MYDQMIIDVWYAFVNKATDIIEVRRCNFRVTTFAG